MNDEPKLAFDLTPLATELARVRCELESLGTIVRTLQHDRTWLDVAEAARVLGVHPATIRRAVRRGTLPSKRVGRCLRVRIEPFDVDASASRIRGRARR